MPTVCEPVELTPGLKYAWNIITRGLMAEEQACLHTGPTTNRGVARYTKPRKQAKVDYRKLVTKLDVCHIFKIAGHIVDEDDTVMFDIQWCGSGSEKPGIAPR
ncbi:hypothetical protein FGRMN_6766 [Fusarium graminum]|nr:hypothetical protein FGRMN_6766 [Fusarium graminum]